MIFGKKIKELGEEHGNEKELLTIWLADKVLDVVEGEDEAKHEAVAYVQKEMTVDLG